MYSKQTVDLLFVEDNETFIKAMSLILEESKFFNYNITPCGYAAKAKELLRINRYDIILLDLILPNGEGTKLVREIRELAPRSETAIIVMTGHATDEDKEVDIRRALANDYIEKGTLTSQELLRRIRNWAIWAIGCREASVKMKGFDTIENKMNETIKTCEQSETLPPYK